MTEIGAVLTTFTAANPGLRVYDYPPPTIVAPAIVVSYPDRIVYDATYGRGADIIRGVPVIAMVGKATDRTARDRVAQYANGSGTSSVKVTLEAHAWVSCQEVVITECTFDVVTVAGVDYIAALFSLDIIGLGS